LAVVALVALLYAAWTNNWGGIQEKTQVVIAFIQGIIQSGLAAIQAFWQQHGDAIMSVVRAAWEFIYSIVEVYIGYVQGIIKAVSYAIEGDWYMFGVTIRETILEAWTRIREIFSQAGERILEIVANLIISIKNWFINTDWRELGSAIINGIVTGLQNGAAAVAQAAGNAARAALDAAKGLLGIQSPSKAFMEVGRDVTRGMAKGITDGTARVETAIDHMVHLPEVAGRSGGNQITVNVDARGGEIGIEERIRRGVMDALREVGLNADARIRVGYGTA
jgi:phage-related protein